MHMKKIFLILITLAGIMACGNADAKETEADNGLVEIFESYTEAKGVQYFNLEGFTLKMARPKIRKTPVGNAADGIESLYIFAMKDVKKEVKAKFVKEAEAVFGTYEMALETNEKGKKSRIFIKKTQPEIIDEMIIYSMENDPVVIYMVGEIPVAEMKGVEAPQQTEAAEAK